MYSSSQQKIEPSRAPLPQQSSTLDAFIDSMPIGVVFIDTQGYVAKSNDMAVSILGLKGFASWSAVYQQLNFDEQWQYFLGEDQQYYRMQLASRTHDGFTLVYILPIAQHGKPHDEQQRFAQLGALSAALAHQIRTPLASLQINADTLQVLNNDEEQHSICRSIAKSIARLRSLVEQMLLFSSGHVDVFERVSLQSLVAAALQGTNTQKLAGVDMIMSDSLKQAPSCAINSELFATALSNYINNSLEAYTQCEGAGEKLRAHYIIFDYCLEDNSLLLIDAAGGVDVSLLKAFQSKHASGQDEAFSFNKINSNKNGGCGLGLAVSKMIIEAHECEIEAYNVDGTFLENIATKLSSQSGKKLIGSVMKKGLCIKIRLGHAQGEMHSAAFSTQRLSAGLVQ